MAFDLGSVVKSSEMAGPPKIVVYGVPGLGKTTFGCTFESPILLRTEDGAAALDVPTFPSVAVGLGDIFDAAYALLNEHPYRTLVVDSLDWMEPLVWANTIARLNESRDRPVKSIEQVGYGKGYVEADAEWRNVLRCFELLRLRRGMAIVLVAHSEIKRHEPPDEDPYDRYQIKLHKRGLAILDEWADMMLFANYKAAERVLTKDGGQKGESKYRAKGSGERVLFTSKRPAFEAKSRWPLPHDIYIGQDRTWAGFHYELNKATNGRYSLPTSLTGQPQPQNDAA